MARTQHKLQAQDVDVCPSGETNVVAVPLENFTLRADLATVRQHLGFHMRRAQTAMKRGFLDATKSFNLTQSQFGILVLLKDNPGAAQTFIAGELGTDRATVMAIVDRLEERDLLARTRSKIDRRRQDMFLTPTGEAMVRQVMLAIEAHELNYVARFSAAERALLIELLRRVYEQPEDEI